MTAPAPLPGGNLTGIFMCNFFGFFFLCHRLTEGGGHVMIVPVIRSDGEKL